ncbi:MAG: hypothetical protein WAL61_15740 [Acidimicrobiales bacterium]
MNLDEVEDWFTDPFGHHESRWMSYGKATDRVRDGRIEGTDPVPSGPFSAKPQRVRYVEGPADSGPDELLKSKGGIAVPGGVVTIEPHRTEGDRVPKARILLRAAVPRGALDVKRDVVVWDEGHVHQLYREGPYDAITVKRPLERIVAELNRDGTDQFISSRGGGASRLLSVTRTTSTQMYEKAALTGIEYYWEKVTRIFRRR